MKYNKILIAAAITTSLFSCKKLDEKFNDSITVQGAGASASVPALLKNIYQGDMRNLQAQDNFWAIQEHSTDECVGPTRAGDWDDNGVWRIIHAQSWDANHPMVNGAFKNLGKIIFDATEILASNPTPQQSAEARFLRAYANFQMVEGWNQCPYREPGGDPLAVPKVRAGAEAIDYVISELEAIKATLPNGGGSNAIIANKDACRVLLMKAYLTKGVVANRTAPTFAAADMNKVVVLADEISGYTLTGNYFDNFAPTNNVLSTENIFTGENIGGSSSGNLRSRYFCSLHYNQNPSGWNGFTTLADFYDKYDVADKRRGGNAYAGVTNVSGLKPGFLIGQQFDQNGVALKDRKNNPLSFTREVSLNETGNNLEVTGIRVVKYPPDYSSGDNINNDFVIYRMSDVMLMRAEAILRGATPVGATALQSVNAVRARAAAPALASVTLDQLIDERGREFYWEGLRRQDLIRFGKFLAPNALKPATDVSRLMFPIPAPQLAANPNLTQNPGY
jgi:starch-binding outer membrane protein, SusD/RagB family